MSCAYCPCPSCEQTRRELAGWDQKLTPPPHPGQVIPLGPVKPYPGLRDLFTPPPVCGQCGIKLEGVMGYACSKMGCPTGLGPISCSVNG